MGSQQRAIATRRVVLTAAARVFEAKGYAAASINDILAEGGVTRGALYFHFSSKHDLARAVIDEQSAWIDKISPRSDSPLQAAVDTTYAFIEELAASVLMRASVRLVTEQGTFDSTSAESQVYQAWADRGEDVFAQAAATGQLRPGWSPRDLSLMMTSYIIGIQLSTAGLHTPDDLAHRVHLFWQAILPSIADPAHAAVIEAGPPTRHRSRRAAG